MADRTEEECALFGAEAEKVYVDHRNAKYVICPTCTEYRITCRAETKMTQLPEAYRTSISRQAQSAPGGTYLHVRVPSVAHEAGVATKALEFEYITRDQK